MKLKRWDTLRWAQIYIGALESGICLQNTEIQEFSKIPSLPSFMLQTSFAGVNVLITISNDLFFASSFLWHVRNMEKFLFRHGEISQWSRIVGCLRRDHQIGTRFVYVVEKRALPDFFDFCLVSECLPLLQLFHTRIPIDRRSCWFSYIFKPGISQWIVPSSHSR